MAEEKKVVKLDATILYGGMILGTAVLAFFRPLASLAILDSAPWLYPIANALIAFGLLMPFFIFYGISLDPMTTILAFLYNWIDGEWSWARNRTDFFIMLLRVVAQGAFSWLAGVVYRAFRNNVALNAAFAPNNVSPIGDVPAVMMIAFLAFIFYTFYMLCAMWTRDSYGVYTMMMFLYLGVSYAGFVIYSDLIDFGMTLAHLGATNVYTVDALWIFIAELLAVIVVAVLYNFIFYPTANHYKKAADNAGDAKMGQAMLNIKDTIREVVTQTQCDSHYRNLIKANSQIRSAARRKREGYTLNNVESGAHHEARRQTANQGDLPVF